MRSIVFFFMFIAIFARAQGVLPESSREYIERMFSGQKIFLWNIENLLDDERGFRSLSLGAEWDGNGIKVTESVIYDLLFSTEDGTYQLVSDDVCSLSSRAAKKMKRVFRFFVRCAKDSRGSYPYLLVIGENNNEIFKEIRDKEIAKHSPIVPSWYDYQVVTAISSDS